MTKLDAYESALFLIKLAISEIVRKPDLRSQLAVIRLRAAVAAMEGNVNMEEFEQKILGPIKRCSNMNHKRYHMLDCTEC